MKILLAENEAFVARSVSLLLERFGHEVTVVSNGSAAFELLSKDTHAAEMLLTDNCMPRQSGLELVRKLRGSNFGKPIAVISAYLSPAERLEYRQLGVTAFFSKPFNVQLLLATIAEYAGLPSPLELPSNTELAKSAA